MKKVINRKIYDTDKSEQLFVWNNGFGTSDFRWCREALYRTKSGVYFLHGQGGAMTAYSQNYGDMQGSGESIVPFDSVPDAVDWLANRGGDDVIEEYFEDFIEDA